MKEDVNIYIKEDPTQQDNPIVVEKFLFFIGFTLPIAWFIGSNLCGKQDKKVDCEKYVWKKRCRIASTLCLTIFLVTAGIIMVINPKLVGLKQEYYSSSAQTSSATNNAIRPGVPVIGTNDYGDTIAGINIEDS